MSAISSCGDTPCAVRECNAIAKKSDGNNKSHVSFHRYLS